MYRKGVVRSGFGKVEGGDISEGFEFWVEVFVLCFGSVKKLLNNFD